MTTATLDPTKTPATVLDRRGDFEGAATPERLIANQIEQTSRQLGAARARVNAARRRVGQLEDAMTTWEHFAIQIDTRANTAIPHSPRMNPRSENLLVTHSIQGGPA